MIMLLGKTHLDGSAALQLWTTRHSFFSAVSFIIGLGIWSLRPWGYITFLALSTLGVLTSLYHYFQYPNLSSYSYLLAIVCLSGSVFFFLQRHIASPYFNPRERWWETAVRFKSSFKIEALVDGSSQPAKLIDISKTGCFVRLQSDLTVGDIVYIKLQLWDINLELMTKVVRSTPTDSGFGLMFLDLNHAEKNDLMNLLLNIQSISENNSAATEQNSQAA